MSRPFVPVAERMWKHVTKTDSCWLWNGHVGKDGYGYIGLGGRYGKSVAVHRLSYEIANGAIPNGLLVCHNCPDGDNRRCVNPDHLWLGTHKDNMQDAKQKGRIASGDRNGSRTRPERLPKGEQHKHARLTAEKVREARTRNANGESLYPIAAEMGVSVPTLWKAVTRETWKHVE